ncbi:MAG: amidophosphoribosyltransferase [Oscillospiraceae bacterium]|jgi:amidophosphoribosyltransferase|nr:amidophosphoribosyltransferase [Oscillospiraceae bacterium]
MSEIHEECGVFGICSYNITKDIVTHCRTALYALQHRGQESCGIVVNNDGMFKQQKYLGLVPSTLYQRRLDRLGEGNICIGHVRYSTTGGNFIENAQPVLTRHANGPLAIAHNGNLTNADELRRRYEMQGKIFQTTNDSEVISYAVTEARLKSQTIEESVLEAMKKIKGAYSLVVMSPSKLIAARDPNGIRPLCLGHLPNGSAVIASESCALDCIGAKLEREIKPGEVFVANVDTKEEYSLFYDGKKNSSLCVFEFVYVARPDSVVEGVSVHQARLNAGKILWEEEKHLKGKDKADIVIGVPSSGLDGALGYANASGIPYGVGFIKNNYVGRTFINPEQSDRVSDIDMKLNVIKSVVDGKRVVLLDDSIVRGNTCRRIIEKLRDAGAKEVHFRVLSPIFYNACYYGIDIDSQGDLVSKGRTMQQIGNYIGVDSLNYLSIKGVKRMAGDFGDCKFCTACFDGKYPVKIPENRSKYKFDQPKNKQLTLE